MAFDASIGEPPPTEIMISDPESFISCKAARIFAIGACSPILEKVAPYRFCDLRIASMLAMMSVYKHVSKTVFELGIHPSPWCGDYFQ
jgi:hypothetical protein